MTPWLTILQADLRRFVRSRLMFVFSVLVLVMYIVFVAIVPDDIQPRWAFATTLEGAPLLDAALSRLRSSDANAPRLDVVRFKDERALAHAFSPGTKNEQNLFIGFAFPPDARERILRSERPEVHLYVDERMPGENQELAEIIGQHVALAALGMPTTTVTANAADIAIGPPHVTRSFREQIRSMLALLILMMEMLALGSLLSKELASGTVHALLTTPVGLPTYFGAKVAFGTLLTFSQAWIVTLFTGGLAPSPAWITLTLAIGAVLFTAGGIVIGTRGHDLMEVLIAGMIIMVPGLVPAVTAILPGAAPLWVQVLPTYPLVMALLSAGDARASVSPLAYVAWALAWTIAALLLALVALRRRVR